MKSSFFKTPRHRVFTYEPVYYDEDKEEMKERVRRVRDELGLEPEEDGTTHADRIRGSMRVNMSNKHLSSLKRERSKSNKRVVIIMVFLGALAYFFLNGQLDALLKLLH